MGWAPARVSQTDTAAPLALSRRPGCSPAASESSSTVASKTKPLASCSLGIPPSTPRLLVKGPAGSRITPSACLTPWGCRARGDWAGSADLMTQGMLSG